MQERWYEKLHEWEKALDAYNKKREKEPDDMNYLLGEMRCLEALGEWYDSNNNIIKFYFWLLYYGTNAI